MCIEMSSWTSKWSLRIYFECIVSPFLNLFSDVGKFMLIDNLVYCVISAQIGFIGPPLTSNTQSSKDIGCCHVESINWQAKKDEDVLFVDGKRVTRWK